MCCTTSTSLILQQTQDACWGRVPRCCRHRTTPRSQVAATGRRPAWQRAAERLLNGSDLYAEKSQQRLQEEGTSHTSRRHPLKGRWEIAPVVDGRICNINSNGGSGGN